MPSWALWTGTGKSAPDCWTLRAYYASSEQQEGIYNPTKSCETAVNSWKKGQWFRGILQYLDLLNQNKQMKTKAKQKQNKEKKKKHLFSFCTLCI